MAEQENMRIMEEFFEAANAHDVDRIAGSVDDAYVCESDTLLEPIQGREAYRELLRAYYRVFPDIRYDIDQMLASGDFVVTRMRLSGSHQGEFRGIRATGRKFELHLCHVDQIKKGKIGRAWVYWDTGTLQRQIAPTADAESTRSQR